MFLRKGHLDGMDTVCSLLVSGGGKGEGGVTSHRRFRVSGIPTVGSRQVNCQPAIIAEAFEAVALLFL